MVMFSIGPRAKDVKDTLTNLRHIPEFIVHLVDQAAKDGMNVCAGSSARGGEMALADFRTAPRARSGRRVSSTARCSTSAASSASSNSATCRTTW